MDDFYEAAAEALGADLVTIRSISNDTLAGSALAAPSAGFGDHEEYPEFATKTAVLLQALASNHPLPDGNKRTSFFARFSLQLAMGTDGWSHWPMIQTERKRPK